MAYKGCQHVTMNSQQMLCLYILPMGKMASNGTSFSLYGSMTSLFSLGSM